MFQGSSNVRCVNNEGSQLGLYHIRDVTNPSHVIGMGESQQLLDRATAEQMWNLLRNAIQQIQSERHQDLNFEELYRYGYYLVLNKYGGMLYNGLRDVISHHVRHKVRSKVLTNLNNNFLQVMNNSWDLHQMSLSIIRDILMYLDRVYVKNHGVDDIFTLGLNLFKDQVVHYSSIQTFLQSKLLNLVMMERQGETIDRPIFRSTTQMLMVLGNNTPNVYLDDFETPFLQQSAVFFSNLGQSLINEVDGNKYLKITEQHISKESERAESCYDMITKPKIVKVVEEELIWTNMKQIVEMPDSGVVYLIKNQLTDHLRLMYQILSRVPDGLKTMFDSISSFLRQKGWTKVGEEVNPITYIESLLEMKKFVDHFIVHSFCDDKLCKQMIASDFEHIVNFNNKSAEYLSLFIDDRLKKCVNGMNNEERSILLDKAIVLFRFLQDKDMFEQFYKQHLAKRLLLSKTINEENEIGVIAKLKAECGFEYTNKMEGMFRDIWKSSTVTEEFHNHVTDTWDPTSGVDLSVKLLTAVYWPLSNIPPPCILPSQPQTSYDSFKKFYLFRHCGRQLTLLPQLGSAELDACFQSKCYTLPVSTYQMCVLMLFNDKSHWTLQELQKTTNIPLKDLLRSLQSLSSGKGSQKILHRQPSFLKDDLGDLFSVNDSFSSKSSRIKIPPIQIKFETGPDSQETVKRVNEERKHEIEAAVVRIMKARKAIKHDMLTNEVTKQLSSRFIPAKEFIKTIIEELIGRGFVARNKRDRRVYEYVA